MIPAAEYEAMVAAIQTSVAATLTAPDPASSDGQSAPARTPADERQHARSLIGAHVFQAAQRRVAANLPALTVEVQDRLARDVYNRMYGLGALHTHLADDRITDIHVNGADQVWLKHVDGTWTQGEPAAASDDDLIDVIRTAAARLGRTERRFDAGSPELNLQLPDGSRLFAIMEVSARPCVSIRKHQYQLSSLNELRANGTIGPELAEFLRAAVLARRTIIIGGGTGVGKTTMLRAVLAEAPATDRIVTIEDALELGIDRLGIHRNVVALESREPNIEGHGAITMDHLVRDGLRMGPDRVLVGEVRGAEVLPMLMAMSQGRDGSMCTVHATTARGVFQRLAMYLMLPPHRLAPTESAALIANAVNLVVHIDQRPDPAGGISRYVTEVLEVCGFDGATVIANDVFAAGHDGRTRPTGNISDGLLDLLEQAGLPRGTLTRHPHVGRLS